MPVQYEPKEGVTLWLNKIGPYHNPMETYSFYDLPFCAPEKQLQPRSKFAGFGEILEGVEYVNSDLQIKFNGALRVPVWVAYVIETSTSLHGYLRASTTRHT